MAPNRPGPFHIGDTGSGEHFPPPRFPHPSPVWPKPEMALEDRWSARFIMYFCDLDTPADSITKQVGLPEDSVQQAMGNCKHTTERIEERKKAIPEDKAKLELERKQAKQCFKCGRRGRRPRRRRRPRRQQKRKPKARSCLQGHRVAGPKTKGLHPGPRPVVPQENRERAPRKVASTSSPRPTLGVEYCYIDTVLVLVYGEMNSTISTLRGKHWCVCNLVFLSRYMRPEGPWKRLGKRWSVIIN